MKKYWLPEHNKMLIIILSSFIPIILLLIWQLLSTNEPKKIINNLEMEFVYIEPGNFMMGSLLSELERNIDENQHEVTLSKGYYLQTTEVTQKQWETVMGNNPSKFIDCGSNCPVENVSWNDVQEFIKKLNTMELGKTYRLPTESEWEYACRCGTATSFPQGNCLSTDQANYNGEYPIAGCEKGENRKTTIPVAALPPNPWGLYGMNGNVWEWCQDFYGDYLLDISDPKGPESGSYRVIRGGSWKHENRKCRSASRDRMSPTFSNSSIGLRLVLLKN